MLSTLLYSTKLKTNPARVLAKTLRRGISVQVKKNRISAAHPHRFGSNETLLLKSILHGSPEAKEAGEALIQQHSAIVARGKYVHGFESESSE